MKTTDEERDIVLRQNEALPSARFQRLRRCCICLQASCADQAACRAEFAQWAERKWDTAVRAECAARGKSLDEAGVVFTW